LFPGGRDLLEQHQLLPKPNQIFSGEMPPKRYLFSSVVVICFVQWQDANILVIFPP